TGRLDAFLSVDLRPRVSGYITEAPFKEGDPVKEGDLLFQIDPRPYKAQVEASEAQVTAAAAQIGVTEANFDMARVANERGMRAGAGASPLERDQLRTQQQASEANLHPANAHPGKAQADLGTAKPNLPPP